MTEPTIPPISPSDPIWGTRGMPDGTLSAVDHIARHSDLGAYAAWLKTVDVAQQETIDSLSSGLYTALAAIADLQTTVNGLSTSYSPPTWQDWTPYVCVNDSYYDPNGSVLTSPSTGSNPVLSNNSSHVQVGRYFQIGKTIMASFSIQFGTSGVNPGVGSYRITLPVDCASVANENQFVLGTGHIFRASEGFAGLGPASFKDVHFHNAPTIGTSTAGLVIGTNLPGASVFTNPDYKAKNHSNDLRVTYEGTTTLVQGTFTVASANRITITSFTQGTAMDASMVGKRAVLVDGTSSTYVGINAGWVNANTIDVGYAHGLSGSGLFTVYADQSPGDVGASVAATIAKDLKTILGQNILDNVGSSVPWTWAANDAIYGFLCYEAA